MSRYTRQHYEDVAHIISGLEPPLPVIRKAALDFADLFAADDPPACLFCGGLKGGATEVLTQCEARVDNAPHNFTQGFDRAQFLAACGLEPEPEYCPKCNKTVTNCAEEGCGINFTGEGSCACREVQPQKSK